MPTDPAQLNVFSIFYGVRVRVRARVRVLVTLGCSFWTYGASLREIVY